MPVSTFGFLGRFCAAIMMVLIWIYAETALKAERSKLQSLMDGLAVSKAAIVSAESDYKDQKVEHE